MLSHFQICSNENVSNRELNTKGGKDRHCDVYKEKMHQSNLELDFYTFHFTLTCQNNSSSINLNCKQSKLKILFLLFMKLFIWRNEGLEASSLVCDKCLHFFGESCKHQGPHFIHPSQHPVWLLLTTLSLSLLIRTVHFQYKPIRIPL